METNKKDTLCWRCKRPGTRTCSWDDSMGSVPVEGWTAEETPFRAKDGEYIKTYNVIDCPLFEPMEDYKERTKNSYGEDTEPKQKKKQNKWEEVEPFLRDGYSDLAIAIKFGLNLDSVRKYKWRWKKKQREMLKLLIYREMKTHLWWNLIWWNIFGVR